MKKIVSIILAALLCLPALVACDNQESTGQTSDEVVLRVDLHGWTPDISDVPTADNPNPYVAPQRIADAFMDQNPNIKIEWVRNKNTGTKEEVMNWFNTQITLETCPAIAFSWGTEYQNMDWYYDLTDIIEQPNEYEEGQPVWKSCFEDYLWKDNTIADLNGRVVAIPIALYPGPASAVYYNEELFEQAGYKQNDTFMEPRTWEEYANMVSNFKTLMESGEMEASSPQYEPDFYPAMTSATRIQFNSWVLQFNVGPSYLDAMLDQIDDSVYDILDMVRDRAGIARVARGQSKDEMIETIRNERKWEFAFEGLRYFDIRRWGIADQVINGITSDEKYDFGSHKVFVSGRDELWPIPQDAIDANPNLLPNNPGY